MDERLRGRRRALDCVGDDRVCRREGNQTIICWAVLSYILLISHHNQRSPLCIESKMSEIILIKKKKDKSGYLYFLLSTNPMKRQKDNN